jgi:hypothetical protein
MARRHSNRGWTDGKRVIRSFGDDRICAVAGCETKLSRYNPDDCCSVHRDQVPQRPMNRRGRP